MSTVSESHIAIVLVVSLLHFSRHIGVGLSNGLSTGDFITVVYVLCLVVRWLKQFCKIWKNDAHTRTQTQFTNCREKCCNKISWQCCFPHDMFWQLSTLGLSYDCNIFKWLIVDKWPLSTADHTPYCLVADFMFTFCISVLPSVLWCCWLGSRKGIRPVKTWVVGCWHGYLSAARCRLAYGPADATATHCLLL